MLQGSFFDPPRDTLEEARAQVQAGLDEGIECPCCGQFAKIYRRKLNASMAKAMCALARYAGDHRWVHLFGFLTKHGVQHSDAPMLRHWGLIEESPTERPDGNPRAGMYRITARGLRFTSLLDTVPEHVLLFNGDVLGWAERRVSLREALGTKFSYDELMRGDPW